MRSLADLRVDEEASVAELPSGCVLADLGLLQGARVRLLRRVGRSALHVRVDDGLECGVSLALAREVFLGPGP